MISKRLLIAVLSVVSALFATGAQAQTTTVPGEQVGLAIGAPLPEGIYGLNTFLYRGNDNGPLDVAVNVPVLVWATPLVPLGGRVELLVAPPTVFAFGKNGGPNGLRDLSINVGTFVGGIWAFDMGNNFGVSFLGGSYLNDWNGDRGVLVNNAGQFVSAPVLPQLSSNTYRFGIALSYTGDGWNLTANLTANIYDSPGRFGGFNTVAFGNTRGPFVISDAVNLDLTATKKFGKFEIGAIGYGTYNFETSAISAAAGNRGNFLLGGLIGYDFGAFTAQAYVARTVATAVAGSEATEGWFRLIVPLYTAAKAEAPASPIIRKY